MRNVRRLLLILAPLAAMAAGGCGIKEGYAPPEVPVYTGPADAAIRPSTAAGDSLVVVSWNIQYGERMDVALAELRAHPRLASADIILLQEMDRQGVADLADSLGLHYAYSPAAVHPHHGKLFGNAVLSRHPITGWQGRILPHGTPLTGHHRIALAADLDLGGGVTLRAVSVHTATMVVDQQKRLEQATAVLDSLVGTGPAVVGGDFNTVSDWEVTLLRRVGRAAGFTHLRLPPGPTIANTVRRLPGSRSMLDHLFVRGLASGSTGVARTTGASDHYPVWAVLARPR